MNNKDIIENLEAKHKAASQQVDFYAKQEILAKDDEKRAFNSREKNFWLGMAYASKAALAVFENSITEKEA